MQCPNCGAQMADVATSCAACGAIRWSEAPTLATVGSPTPPFTTTPPGYGAPPPPFVGVTPQPFLPSAPKRKRRWPRLLAVFAGLIVIAGIAVGAYAYINRGPHYPSHWDARVGPIATQVEALRGLTFKHPVPVNYLPAKEFEKKVTDSPADVKKAKKEIDQATGLLRAAGLIGGNVDLAKAANDTQAADTIAFYDPDTKAIYVRGSGAFTVNTRVTLAHELTHVLQDQYYDLPKLQKRAYDSKTGSSDALTALIEGDAVHTENRYVAAQSPADRKEYARLSNADSSAANDRTKDVPAVIGTLFGAPYIFGPQIIDVLYSTGGNQAINDALTGPTPTTRIYLDPTALNDAPTLPPVPALQAGEKKESTGSANDDAFDDFTLYLMLGARIDRPTALRAADAYSTGSEVLYSKSGKTCFRATIEGINPAADAYLHTVLQRWTESMPDAAIDSSGAAVTFHSCDPGKNAPAPSNAAINEATSFAVTRAAFTDQLVTKDHATTQLATCASRLFFESPSLRSTLLGKSTLPAAQIRQEASVIGFTCRSNASSGLP